MKTPVCANTSLRIVNRDLALSLGLAFSGPAKPKKATHFKKEAARLLLAEGEADGFIPLMVPLDAQSILPMVSSWLEVEAVYPEQQQLGDTWREKGWSVSTNEWGHVEGMHNAFVAIEPAWALVGK